MKKKLRRCHRGIEWFGMVWKYGKYEFTVRESHAVLTGT